MVKVIRIPVRDTEKNIELDFKHTETTWEVVRYEDGSPITIHRLDKSNVYLTTYIFNFDIPKNQTYYIRAKLHFFSETENRYLDDPNIEDNWTNVIELSNDVKHSNDYFIPQAKIETPTVIGDNISFNRDEEFNVTTSSFRGYGDKHYSTDWIIRDQNGDVIQVSLNDVENLKEFIVKPQSDTTSVTIHVRHNGYSGTSSPFYKVVIPTSGKFVVDISTKFGLNDLNPFADIEIIFNSIGSIDIYKIEVVDTEDNVIKSVVVDQQGHSFIVDNQLIRPISRYKVIVYPTNDVYTELVYYITTGSAQDIDVIDGDRVYSDTTSTSDLPMSNNFTKTTHTKELIDNSIPIYNDDTNSISFIKYRDNTLSEADKFPSEYLKKVTDNVNVDLFKTITIGIRTVLFLVSDFNSKKIYFRIVDIIKQEIIQSISFDCDNCVEDITFVYLQHLRELFFMENSFFYKYSIETNSFTKLATRPNIIGNSGLGYIGNGKILSAGNNIDDKNLTYIYDPVTNTWSEYILTHNSVSKATHFHIIKLKDGNLLMHLPNISCIYRMNDKTFDGPRGSIGEIHTIVELRDGGKIFTKKLNNKIDIYT